MDKKYNILQEFSLIQTKASQYNATRKSGHRFEALIEKISYVKSYKAFLKHIEKLNLFDAYDLINYAWCLKYADMYKDFEQSKNFKVYYSTMQSEYVIIIPDDNTKIEVKSDIATGSPMVLFIINDADGKEHRGLRDALYPHPNKKNYRNLAYGSIKLYIYNRMKDLFIYLIK